MVHKASEIADSPAPARAGKLVRRPLSQAVKEEREALGPKLLGLSGSLLLAMYVASLMIPAAFRIGSFRITPYTGLLLIFIIPLFITFLRDKTNRFVALDFCIVGHVVWGAFALLHAHGIERIVFVTNTSITSLGGYMVARVLIRNHSDYEKFFRYFFYGLLFFMPFALFEMVTKRVLVSEFFSFFMEVQPRPNNDPRLGLSRAQVFTEHPITFGLFCSIGVANLFYIYRGQFMRRMTRTGVAVFMTLLSLSSAPTIAVGMQFILIGWDQMLARARYKWVLLIVVIAVPLSVVQLAAPDGLVGLVINNLSYNPQTGWARTTIFEYGIAEVWRHPFFGIGMNEWIRPWWFGPSVDNFWLLMAMRYGLPALLFLWVGLAVHAIQIMSRKGLTEQDAGCRSGYIIAWTGVFFILGTVHIWGSTAIFIMTYIGAGAWIYTGTGSDSANRYQRARSLEQEGVAARAAQPAETPPRRISSSDMRRARRS